MSESLICKYKEEKEKLIQIRQLLENSRTMLAKNVVTEVFGVASDYIKLALDDIAPEIVQRALRIAESDVEKARIAARKEAEEILQQTA